MQLAANKPHYKRRKIQADQSEQKKRSQLSVSCLIESFEIQVYDQKSYCLTWRSFKGLNFANKNYLTRK